MSLRDETSRKALEWMQSTDPECPTCKSKGLWNYSTPDILHSVDSKTGVDWITPIVLITCGECGQEMQEFRDEN